MYKPYPTVKNKWDKPVITCYYYHCYNAYVLFIATPVSFVINDSVVGFVFLDPHQNSCQRFSRPWDPVMWKLSIIFHVKIINYHKHIYININHEIPWLISNPTSSYICNTHTAVYIYVIYIIYNIIYICIWLYDFLCLCIYIYTVCCVYIYIYYAQFLHGTLKWDRGTTIDRRHARHGWSDPLGSIIPW